LLIFLRYFSIDYLFAASESDMLDWHFTIRGADDTDFAGGYYHGRIKLPPDYPFKPPHILFLTPSGRFAVNTEICLSFSAFHPESWQPAWGIRLILEALISFLPTPTDGAIGALNWSSSERRRLATKSKDFVCPCCGKISDVITRLDAITEKNAANEATTTTSRFQKEIEQLQLLQQQQHKLPDGGESGGEDAAAAVEGADTGETGEAGEVLLSADDTFATTEGSRVVGASQITPDASLGADQLVLARETEVLQRRDEAESGNISHESDEQTSDDLMRARAATVVAAAVTAERARVQEAAATADRLQVQEAPAIRQPPTDGNSAAVPFFFSDPILHSIIVVLISILYLLYRKLELLIEELYDFDE
jgi:ubiquitin-conjugating enzyme E2 J1